MRKQNGFSIIEILVAIAILGLLLSIASPVYLRALKASQESAAVNVVRQISDAEGVYFQMYGSFGPSISELGGPSPCTTPTASMSCILDSSISVAPFTKSGYFFSADGTINTTVNDGQGNSWSILLGYEINGSPTGMINNQPGRALCTDQTGVIKFIDGQNAPIGTFQNACSNVTTTGTSGPVGQ